MQYKRLTLNIEKDNNVKRYFKILIDLLPQLPELKRLIDEATQDGPITVDFVSRAQSITGGHFSQKWDIDPYGNISNLRRFIKVVRERSFEKMLSTFVFELCNAKNPDFKINSPTYIKPEDFINRDEYAFATEGAEYNYTHLPAKQILRSMFTNENIIELFRQNGITFTKNELYNLRKDHFASFDDWWDHVNQVNSDCPIKHSDTYREQYDSVMGRRRPLAAQAERPTAAPKAKTTPAKRSATKPVQVKPTPALQPTTKAALPAQKQGVKPVAAQQSPKQPTRPVAAARSIPPKVAAPSCKTAGKTAALRCAVEPTVWIIEVQKGTRPQRGFMPLLTVKLQPTRQIVDEETVSEEMLARISEQVGRRLRASII